MSHLFVLERMTAHINIRGRNKSFATPPLVLCSVPLPLYTVSDIQRKKWRAETFFMTLFVPERSERNGKNYGQLLDEQEEMLEALELDKTFYFGLHPSNVVPMQGWLPEDKDALLKTIRKARKNLKNRLSEVPIRGGEGSILR